MSEIEGPGERARRDWPAWLVIAAYVVVAAFTFLDYGVTWDEELQARYGEMVIDYFASGFRDQSWNHLLNLSYYGPLFEVLPALVHRAVGAWKFEVRHALIALSAAVGLIGVLKIGQRLAADWRLPTFAVLSLVLMPAYYGHTFFNSKDIPFATLFTWAMYGLIRLPDESRWKSVIRFGVLTGLTLALRIAGVLVFALGVAAFAAAAALDRGWRGRLPELARRLALGAVVAWIVMVAIWPTAHLNPIATPLEALRESARFSPAMDVLFEGETWTSRTLPRRYVVKMLAITMPLPILTLFAIGFAVALRQVIRRNVPLPLIVILLWCVVPIALHAALRSPAYDGTRHFLFVYQALALLASVGAVTVIDAVGGGRLATAAIIATLLAVVPPMVRLHPYQYVFYNASVGGTAGAADRYETDYWGASLSESARWVAANKCGGRTTSVVAAADPWLSAGFAHILGDGVSVHPLKNRKQIPPPEDFDYYLGFRRFGWHELYPERPIVHRVERAGVTLGLVRGGCGHSAETDSMSHSR